MSLVTELNTLGYNAMLYLKLQEKGKLAKTVMQNLGGFGGAEFVYADATNSREATEITDRLGNTNWQEPDLERRRIGKKSYEFTTLLDKIEKLDRIADPTNNEFKNAVYALGRKTDKLIIDNILGNVYMGNSGTATSLPSSQTIANGGTDITVAKLIEALELFNTQNVDPDEKKYCVIGPKQISALLNITELTSADYNAIKVLVEGKVASFMGFDFIMSNQLSATGGVRSCIAYTESAFELVVDQNMITTADRLPERRNAIGIQTQYSLGGTRIDDYKVVEIECSE